MVFFVAHRVVLPLIYLLRWRQTYAFVEAYGGRRGYITDLQALQRGEEINCVAVGIDDDGVALAPEGVPRRFVAGVARRDDTLVQGVHLRRGVALEGERDALPHGIFDVLRIDALHHLQRIPGDAVAVGRGDIDIWFAFDAFGYLKLQQP